MSANIISMEGWLYKKLDPTQSDDAGASRFSDTLERLQSVEQEQAPPPPQRFENQRRLLGLQKARTPPKQVRRRRRATAPERRGASVPGRTARRADRGDRGISETENEVRLLPRTWAHGMFLLPSGVAVSRSVFDDFPGLLDASKRAEKAVDVLRSAIDQTHPPRDGETLSDLATRLRGASVLAHSAGLELATVAGWNEAASAANDAGLLDGEERDAG